MSDPQFGSLDWIKHHGFFPQDFRDYQAKFPQAAWRREQEELEALLVRICRAKTLLVRSWLRHQLLWWTDFEPEGRAE